MVITSAVYATEMNANNGIEMKIDSPVTVHQHISMQQHNVRVVSNSIKETNERTNGSTHKETCLFVRCVCQGRPSY